MVQTQSSPEPTAHGGDNGWRSQDVVVVAADIRGTTKGDESLGSKGMTSVVGGASTPKDWGEEGAHCSRRGGGTEHSETMTD